MIYLALYDDVGNCQRVATAKSRAEAAPFLEAGFIEVTKEVYNECSKTAPFTLVRHLAGLAAAVALLNSLLRSQRIQVQVKSNQIKLRALQQAFRGVARAEAARVTSGDISPDDWYKIMSTRLKQLHVASAAAAVGGLTGLNKDILNEVKRNISDQLIFLRRFRDQLQAGIDSDNPLSEAQVGARAAMYGSSSTATFETAATLSVGMPLLPAYPGIRTICLSHCKCAWQHEKLPGNGNWNCFWKLSPVENCPTCLARRRSFSPLRIRNGIIQPYPTAGIYA